MALHHLLKIHVASPGQYGSVGWSIMVGSIPGPGGRQPIYISLCLLSCLSKKSIKACPQVRILKTFMWLVKSLDYIKDLFPERKLEVGWKRICFCFNESI